VCCEVSDFELNYTLDSGIPNFEQVSEILASGAPSKQNANFIPPGVIVILHETFNGFIPPTVNNKLWLTLQDDAPKNNKEESKSKESKHSKQSKVSEESKDNEESEDSEEDSEEDEPPKKKAPAKKAAAKKAALDDNSDTKPKKKKLLAKKGKHSSKDEGEDSNAPVVVAMRLSRAGTTRPHVDYFSDNNVEETEDSKDSANKKRKIEDSNTGNKRLKMEGAQSNTQEKNPTAKQAAAKNPAATKPVAKKPAAKKPAAKKPAAQKPAAQKLATTKRKKQ
jgi:hypothetical protein